MKVANEDGISQLVDRNGQVIDSWGVGEAGVIGAELILEETPSYYLAVGRYLEGFVLAAIFMPLILSARDTPANIQIKLLWKRLDGEKKDISGTDNAVFNIIDHLDLINILPYIHVGRRMVPGYLPEGIPGLDSKFQIFLHIAGSAGIEGHGQAENY